MSMEGKLRCPHCKKWVLVHVWQGIQKIISGFGIKKSRKPPAKKWKEPTPQSPLSMKQSIMCSITVENLKPCIICMNPTRHRHSIHVVGESSWRTGTKTAVCEDCCNGAETKPVPPSIRNRYMMKKVYCLHCGFMGDETLFKRWKSSTWYTCPNCNTKKEIKGKDRYKSMQRIFVVAREFVPDYWLLRMKRKEGD